MGTHGYHVPEDSGECPGGLWQCLRLPPSVPFDDGPGPCARMFYLLACDADIPSLSKQDHKILNPSSPPPKKKSRNWPSTWAFVLLLPTRWLAGPNVSRFCRGVVFDQRGAIESQGSLHAARRGEFSSTAVWMGMGTCHAAGYWDWRGMES